MSEIDDIFRNNDLWKPKEKAKKTALGQLADSVTNTLANIGEGALRGLPDVLSFGHDLLQDASAIVNPSIAPNNLVVPGTSPAAKKIQKSFDEAEDKYTGGKTPKPKNKVDQYAHDISEGIAGGLLGGGPEAAIPAVLSGAAGALAGRGVYDLTGNDTLSTLAGLAAGIAVPGAHAYFSSPARTIARGASHPNFSSLVRTVEDLEGGGTLDNPKVNPKSGAMGPMQVTPETARQPGYRIRPWNGKDQADLARVGRQKLAALNGKYGGDTDKVLAAYNWGEGNLDAAIKKYGDDWYSHAPHETQDYVANGARQLGEGGSVGGPVRSMEPEDIASALGDKQAEDLQDLASVSHDFPVNFANAEDYARYKEIEAHLDQVQKDFDAGKITEEELNTQYANLIPEFTRLQDPLTRDNNIVRLGQKDPLVELENTLKDVQSGRKEFITPAERQDMDASVPTQPVDNTGYEKHTPYVEEPPVPANDAETFKSLDEFLDTDGNIKPEWRFEAKKFAENARERGDPIADWIEQRLPERDLKAVEEADYEEGPSFSSEPPAGGGGGEEPPVSRSDEELTDKLALTVKNAKPLREQQESLYHKERSKRLKAMQDAAKMTSGEDRVRARLAALGGDLPKVDYEGVRGQFSQEEINRLNDIIEEHPRLGDFDKVHAEAGLKKLLEGSVPTHGELRLLAEAFPDKVIKAILDKREFGEKFNDFILNASSASRALRASGDLSAPLRQGINLIGTKAFWKSFFTMFKSMGKEGFEAVQNEIASRPTFPLMQRSGLAITKVSRILDDREEMFLSTWAEKLPHVKYSERAYIAFLNKLRADTFDSLVKQSYAAGIDFREQPKYLKDIATYVNNATGRGSLGQLAGSYKLLNATLFAPRLMASRAKMLTWFFNPSFYTTLSPVVRRAYISNMIKMGGIVGTAVGLAKMGGLGVDVDPRSSDFGKIKVGNTRFDPWGGYQQYVRLASVMAAGEKVSPTTGAVTSLTDGKFGHGTRFDAAVDFLRNKESPMMSIVDDLLSLPKDRFGQKITPTKEAISLFVPMVEEDIRQAWQDNHAAGIAAGPAAMFGVGVQTYQPKEPSPGDGVSDPLKEGGVDDIFNDKSLWGDAG